MQTYPPESFLAPLEESTRAHVRELAATLHDAGFQCWLVGGSVRDLLLNRPVGDLDFTTDAKPESVRRAFRRTIPTGIQHGTVTVLLEREPFEVTTFRGESEYSDARHPDRVRFSSSLSEDLTRRDFTVNALAWNPLTGKLVDEHGGIDDLANGVLRTIGRPEDRFFEDGLRPVRACRFAATLGFEPDPAVLAALSAPAVQRRTAFVAVERFADELRKGLAAEAASRMVRLLEQTGICRIFLATPTVLSDAALRNLDALHPGAVELKLAFWWKASGLADPGEAARRLKLSRREERSILLYARVLDFVEGNPHPTRNQVRRLLSEIRESLGDLSASFLDGIPWDCFPGLVRAELYESLAGDPLTIGDLAIGGKELLERGVAGPAVGKMLRRLLGLVLDEPERNTEADLLAAVERLGAEPKRDP